MVFAGWDLGFLPKGRLWPSSSLEMPETWAPSPWSDSCDWAPPDLGLCWKGLVFSKGETAAMYLPRVARNLALESPVGQLRLDTFGLVLLLDGTCVFSKGRRRPFASGLHPGRGGEVLPLALLPADLPETVWAVASAGSGGPTSVGASRSFPRRPTQPLSPRSLRPLRPSRI